MKCQDFEVTINSLARGQLVEATAREQVLAHVEQCANCADVYADQCAVAAGVHAVVASLADRGASPRVEEALRHAFCEQARQTEASASRIPALRWHWPRWANGALAAAAILLLVLLTGVMWVKTKPAAQKLEANHHPPASASPTPEARKETFIPSDVVTVPEQKLASASDSARSKIRHAVRRAPVRHTEVATRFYPLVEEDELVRLESGQVVRVELPASTLIALGLPISAENRNRPVQADLLLGQDGLARAIRFLP